MTIFSCSNCDTPFESEQRLTSKGSKLYRVCMMCGTIYDGVKILTDNDVLHSGDRSVIEEVIAQRRKILLPAGMGYEVVVYVSGEETLRLDARTENWALESVSEILERDAPNAVRISPWQWEFVKQDQIHLVCLDPIRRFSAGSMSFEPSMALAA